LISAVPLASYQAITHRITKRIHMPAGPPNLRVHEDGGFESGDIIALADDIIPPEIFDVAFEFGAERAVIPEAVDAAVDFGGWVDEAAAFAERHDFFHQRIFFGIRHKAGSVCEGPGDVKVSARPAGSRSVGPGIPARNAANDLGGAGLLEHGPPKGRGEEKALLFAGRDNTARDEPVSENTEAGSAEASKPQTTQSMNWYYAEGGQQQGPATEEELRDLVEAGVVKGDTLVWHEGLADWQPYRRVKGEGRPVEVAEPQPAAAEMPPEDGVVCSQCNKIFARDEAVRFGDTWVCAGCKPVYVQRLKEGAALPGALKYAGFWIRFAAKFVDGIVMRVVGMAAGYATGLALAPATGSGAATTFVVAYTLGFILDIAYRTVFVGAFGATPGKMAVKVRIVTAEGTKVSYARALARALAEYISALILLIGYIMAAFDGEKRTLHDRICGTRVVKAGA
jgi:uncharacterized RDD family membrane protein YckC